MNPRLALQMLASAMQRTCTDDSEQLHVCDSVATLAPLLPAETVEDARMLKRMESEAAELARMIRFKESRQMNFTALLAGELEGDSQ